MSVETLKVLLGAAGIGGAAIWLIAYVVKLVIEYFRDDRVERIDRPGVQRLLTLILYGTFGIAVLAIIAFVVVQIAPDFFEGFFHIELEQPPPAPAVSLADWNGLKDAALVNDPELNAQMPIPQNMSFRIKNNSGVDLQVVLCNLRHRTMHESDTGASDIDTSEGVTLHPIAKTYQVLRQKEFVVDAGEFHQFFKPSGCFGLAIQYRQRSARDWQAVKAIYNLFQTSNPVLEIKHVEGADVEIVATLNP